MSNVLHDKIKELSDIGIFSDQARVNLNRVSAAMTQGRADDAYALLKKTQTDLQTVIDLIEKIVNVVEGPQ